MKIPENAFRPFPDATREDLRRIVGEVLDVDVNPMSTWGEIASQIETQFPEQADLLRDAEVRWNDLFGDEKMMRWANKPTELIFGWFEREDPNIRSEAAAAAKKGRLREFVESVSCYDMSSGLAEDLLSWTLDQIDWKQLKKKLSEPETQ